MRGIFSDFIVKSNAEFISYGEVMLFLQESSGDSFAEIAIALKIWKLHENYAVCRMDAENGFFDDEEGHSISRNLDLTISTNEINSIPEDDDFCSIEFGSESIGWIREKFVSAVEKATGILLPSVSTQKMSGASVSTLSKNGHPDQKLTEAYAQVEMLKAQISTAQQTIDDLRRLIGDQSAIAPHNIHLMKIAIQVQRDYWSDLEVPPKQDPILAELQQKYNLSMPEAMAVERVACPINRKK